MLHCLPDLLELQVVRELNTLASYKSSSEIKPPLINQPKSEDLVVAYEILSTGRGSFLRRVQIVIIII